MKVKLKHEMSISKTQRKYRTKVLSTTKNKP